MRTVKSITVEFSRGSFQEWTEASGDTYPQAFIDEWETNYNRIITDRLQEAFPGRNNRGRRGIRSTNAYQN